MVYRIDGGYILVETERKSNKPSKNKSASTKTAKGNSGTKTVDESKYRDYFDFSVQQDEIEPHQVRYL